MKHDSSRSPALADGAADSARAAPVARLSVVAALARVFRAHGVKRMFGVPGGGSSLDLIQAAERERIDFVLARHECAAVFMAAASAEIEGGLGVAITTKGPGTANAANGVAHAALDRTAVAVVTDGFSAQTRSYVTHQWFDQRALLAPVTKGHNLLDQANAGRAMVELMALARQPRRGPVHVELTGSAARGPAGVLPEVERNPHLPQPSAGALASAKRLLASSRRPVVIVGLEAAEPGISRAVRSLVRKLGCPVLVTYKAKGVVVDGDAFTVGIFTGGAAEQPTV
ncbi:MAG: thiamine pyrophosphate-binding protein, partial [Burkholderiales bacterium]